MANRYADLEKFLTKTFNDFVGKDCKKRIVEKTKQFVLEECSFTDLMECIEDNFNAGKILLDEKNLDEYMERVVEIKIIRDNGQKELDEKLEKSINGIYHYLGN